MLKVKGVLEVYADLRASEVEVIARKGEVAALVLVETVNKTQDSEHGFQAKLKKGPEPVE
ncbi:MAG: hypothetical protein HY820_26845 [Acidobacteria bacterium]|nr:hypothetical protein [Acidobacteriota bacterium]